MIEIPITIHSDEKGYLDRECPNENCLFTFKIQMSDWESKIENEVHCPMCGHIDIPDRWWTKQQLDNVEKIASDWALSFMQGELDKCFRSLERHSRRNKFIKMKYEPGRQITFTNNPIGQSPEWEHEIVCPKCTTRYSVIGSAYFCPCCGNNSIEETLSDALQSIVKMIESLPVMEALLAKTQGKDTANTICRSMLESSLGDCVSAFQKFSELRYRSLSSMPVRANDFQNIEKGSSLFKEATGKGYNIWLTESDLHFMNLMFQRRHLMVHNGGLVDEQYIKKSADHNYNIGQRLVVRDKDVIKLIQTIEQLCKGLKSLNL